MAAFLSPLGGAGWQFFNDQGNVLAGGMLYTYLAGTTTPAATYTTSVANVANPNPIILNAEGRTPQEVWLTGGTQYKFVVQDATSVTVTPGTWDNISGVNDVSTLSTQWVSSGLTPTFINSTNFSVPGNQTAVFQQGRRVQIAVTAGTVYGYVQKTTFSTNTTVQVVLDSGALDSGISSVNYGLLTSLTESIPQQFFYYLNILDPRFGVVGDGVTDDTAAVNAVISFIGSSNVTLLVKGTMKISGTLTFGFNTELLFQEGGKFVGTAGTESIQVQRQINAGRYQIFSNCVPTATNGMTVYPDWFGAQINNSGFDSGPAFNSAYKFLSNTGGTINMSPGTYTISTTIVNNWGHIRLVGQGLNITTISMTSATLGAIQNYGVAGTPIANCTFEDFSLLCSAAGSSTGSFGLDLQYCSVTHLRNMQIQEFLFGLGLLRATNTEVDFVECSYVAGSTNGFIAFNLNGGGTGTGGNASSNFRDCSAAGLNTLTGSIGFKMYGVYMSDYYFDNCATAGTNYGYSVDYTSAPSFNEDIIIRQPIVDQFTTQGIFVSGLPAGGRLTISDGWINPKSGANNATTCIYVTGSGGNILINGNQLVADSDIIHTTGVYLLNSTGTTISANAICNTNIGVGMSGSGYNSITGNQFNNVATAATYFVQGVGDARTMVTGNSFTGFATVGVEFDNTSSGSGVVANTFNVTHIGTRIQNSASTPVGSSDGSTGLNSGF
jgi:hypothetical protein